VPTRKQFSLSLKPEFQITACRSLRSAPQFVSPLSDFLTFRSDMGSSLIFFGHHRICFHLFTVFADFMLTLIRRAAYPANF
jgi:hypothetical protein